MAGRIRIRLKAFDHAVIDQASADIVRTAEKTGAHTTDITRVWPIGTVSAAQRRDYTLVPDNPVSTLEGFRDARAVPRRRWAVLGADHGELTLAVLLQCPDQPSGPRSARGRQQDAQRTQSAGRHTTHRPTSKHSAKGRPISMPCVRARLRMYSSFA